MADSDRSIVVAVPKRTAREDRVKKRERKPKALGAVSHGVRRSFRLVIAESLEFARNAAAAAAATPPSSPSTPGPSPRRARSKKNEPARKKAEEPGVPRLGPLIPTKRKDWYCIKGIINEATRGGKTSYLIEWDGFDPSTGTEWPAEWIDSSWVSKSAIKAWDREKTKYMADRETA